MTEQSLAPATQEPTSDKSSEDSTFCPYLKAFGANIGVIEFELRKRLSTIGRSQEADFTLPNRSVSRIHARILQEGDRFIIEDTGSKSGLVINGERVERHVLKHGDGLEIAVYTLEFRTEPEAAGAQEAAGQAEALLRGKYRSLPSNVKLRFRTLSQGAASTMTAAATLPTERGGLLIPTATPPDDGASLELELAIPGGNTGRILADVIGVIEKGDTKWMCVRLHRLPRRQHDVVVAGTEPGPWAEAVPT